MPAARSHDVAHAPGEDVPRQREGATQPRPHAARRHALGGAGAADRDGIRNVASGMLRIFLFTGLATVLAVTLIGVLLVREAATREAIRVAEETTYMLAHNVIEPELDADVLAGDDDALQRLDAVIRPHLVEEEAVRLKLWTTSGRVVFSDEPGLVGRTFRLDAGKRESLRTEGVAAEVSQLSSRENAFERGEGRLLEVYVPIRASDGTPLLLEVYFPYRLVTDRGREVAGTIGPILAVVLAVLAVGQLLLGAAVVRRLRLAQAHRENVLLHALEASDAERRRIAADLHDGVVQQLVASSLALEVEAKELGGMRPRGHPDVQTDVARELRKSVRALRALFVDIYPPDLQADGLHAALDDLLAPLRERGVAVSTDLADTTQQLPLATEAVIYRVAQEAVRNVVRHAAPRHVVLALRHRGDAVDLEVTDDGCGFRPEAAAEHARAGHLGFRLISDLAHDAGGTLQVDSAPRQGTRVRLTLPVRVS